MVTPDVPRPRYGDARRPWHPAFVEYMYMIVDHPNYAGMPCTIDDVGKIDWTIPSNRARGSKNWNGNQRRGKWWAARAEARGIPRGGHWISKTAKALHPTFVKPCQTCGRKMHLAFVYPTTRTIDKLNSHLPAGSQLDWGDLLNIDEVIDHFHIVLEDKADQALSAVFGLLDPVSGADHAKSLIAEHYTEVESRMFSPGAMSNAPDRLDGFHTYNLCCRSTQDLGRAADNLRTYSDDRRAFEHWSEGDWSAANYLMTQTGYGECPSCLLEKDLTADHVGPLSLGFAHTPNFQVLCGKCNSAKNNRMSAADVKKLLSMEEQGISVVSFQASPLWDALKHQVETDDDALLLSKLMRISQHQYLMALSEALEVPDVLLQFLHPEFAKHSVVVVGLNPESLEYEQLVKVPRAPTYAASKAGPMVRIAFDALRDYSAREGRNVQVVDDRLIREELEAYRAAIDRTRGTPSSIRDDLRSILEADESDEIRSRRLITLFDGSYLPDEDFGSVRNALVSFTRAVTRVLTERYLRGEAVDWDD